MGNKRLQCEKKYAINKVVWLGGNGYGSTI